jgi:hypothetical protein
MPREGIGSLLKCGADPRQIGLGDGLAVAEEGLSRETVGSENLDHGA